ncbi:hypothetical protein D9615_009306 [Tricholomella constricta]|uniref:Uncharacterized protein n=1 Tax=Tricholomella constricta TaxID=117010 RepID=A0A8H5LWP3_9AGAR|nr:hypothetical protein D9615_009306 [Tricholomella constricta]
MSSGKLINVARSLNAKLPAGMAIDIDHVLPMSYIWSSIERTVGLRGDVPQAPKAPRLLTEERDLRMRAEFDMLTQMNKSPPTPSQGQLSSLVIRPQTR